MAFYDNNNFNNNNFNNNFNMGQDTIAQNTENQTSFLQNQLSSVMRSFKDELSFNLQSLNLTLSGLSSSMNNLNGKIGALGPNVAGRYVESGLNSGAFLGYNSINYANYSPLGQRTNGLFNAVMQQNFGTSYLRRPFNVTPQEYYMGSDIRRNQLGTTGMASMMSSVLPGVIEMGGSLGGAALGATIGSAILPGVGTFVGSMLGGWAGSTFAQSVNTATNNYIDQAQMFQRMSGRFGSRPFTWREALNTSRGLQRLSYEEVMRTNIMDSRLGYSGYRDIAMMGLQGGIFQGNNSSELLNQIRELGEVVKIMSAALGSPDVKNTMDAIIQMKNMGLNTSRPGMGSYMQTLSNNAFGYGFSNSMSAEQMLKVGMQIAQSGFGSNGIPAAVGVNLGMQTQAFVNELEKRKLLSAVNIASGGGTTSIASRMVGLVGQEFQSNLGTATLFAGLDNNGAINFRKAANATESGIFGTLNESASQIFNNGSNPVTRINYIRANRAALLAGLTGDQQMQLMGKQLVNQLDLYWPYRNSTSIGDRITNARAYLMEKGMDEGSSKAMAARLLTPGEINTLEGNKRFNQEAAARSALRRIDSLAYRWSSAINTPVERELATLNQGIIEPLEDFSASFASASRFGGSFADLAGDNFNSINAYTNNVQDAQNNLTITTFDAKNLFKDITRARALAKLKARTGKPLDARVAGRNAVLSFNTLNPEGSMLQYRYDFLSNIEDAAYNTLRTYKSLGYNISEDNRILGNELLNITNNYNNIFGATTSRKLTDQQKIDQARSILGINNPEDLERGTGHSFWFAPELKDIFGSSYMAELRRKNMNGSDSGLSFMLNLLNSATNNVSTKPEDEKGNPISIDNINYIKYLDEYLKDKKINSYNDIYMLSVDYLKNNPNKNINDLQLLYATLGWNSNYKDKIAGNVLNTIRRGADSRMLHAAHDIVSSYTNVNTYASKASQLLKNLNIITDKPYEEGMFSGLIGKNDLSSKGMKRLRAILDTAYNEADIDNGFVDALEKIGNIDTSLFADNKDGQSMFIEYLKSKNFDVDKYDTQIKKLYGLIRGDLGIAKSVAAKRGKINLGQMFKDAAGTLSNAQRTVMAHTYSTYLGVNYNSLGNTNNIDEMQANAINTFQNAMLDEDPNGQIVINGKKYSFNKKNALEYITTRLNINDKTEQEKVINEFNKLTSLDLGKIKSGDQSTRSIAQEAINNIVGISSTRVKDTSSPEENLARNVTDCIVPSLHAIRVVDVDDTRAKVEKATVEKPATNTYVVNTTTTALWGGKASITLGQ